MANLVTSPWLAIGIVLGLFGFLLQVVIERLVQSERSTDVKIDNLDDKLERAIQRLKDQIDDFLRWKHESRAETVHYQSKVDALYPDLSPTWYGVDMAYGPDSCFRTYRIRSLFKIPPFIVSDEDVVESGLPLTWWDKYAEAWLTVQEHIIKRARGTA